MADADASTQSPLIIIARWTSHDNKVESKNSADRSVICWCGNGNYTFINRCLRSETNNFNDVTFHRRWRNGFVRSTIPCQCLWSSFFGAVNLLLSASRISKAKAIIIVNEWYCILMRKKQQMTNEHETEKNQQWEYPFTDWRTIASENQEENGNHEEIKICYFVIRIWLAAHSDTETFIIDAVALFDSWIRFGSC